MSLRKGRLFYLNLLWFCFVLLYVEAASTRQPSQRPFGVGRRFMHQSPSRMRNDRNETPGVQTETMSNSETNAETAQDSPSQRNTDDTDKIGNVDDDGPYDNNLQGSRRGPRPRLPDWLSAMGTKTAVTKQTESVDDQGRQQDGSSKRNTTLASSSANETVSIRPERFWPSDNESRHTPRHNGTPTLLNARDVSHNESTSSMTGMETYDEAGNDDRSQRVRRGLKGWLLAQKEKENSSTMPKEVAEPNVETQSPSVGQDTQHDVPENDDSDKSLARDVKPNSSMSPQPPLSSLRDALNRFRDRIRPTNDDDNTDRQEISSKNDTGGENSLQVESPSFPSSAPNETNKTDSRQMEPEASPLGSRLEKIAANAKTWIQQLPWRPLEQIDEAPSIPKTEPDLAVDASVNESCVQESALLVHTNETPTPLDEQAIGREKLSQSGPLVQRVKQSAVNATTFLRRLVPNNLSDTAMNASDNRASISLQSNTSRLAARHSSSPIAIIRNLPWTPEGGAKFNDDSTQALSPEKVNPIQFIRALPWTPRRANDTEYQSVQAENVPKHTAVSHIPNETVSIDSKRKDRENKRGTGATASNGEDIPDVIGDEIQDETLLGPSTAGPDNDEKVAENDLSLVDAPLVAEEDGSIMAIDVEDALSKYLSRHNEESDSRDVVEDDMELDSNMNDVSTTGTFASTRINEREDTVRDKNETDASISTQRQESSSSTRSAEEVDGGTGNANILSLDSLVRRVLGSIEDQQKDNEARRASTGTDVAPDTRTANVTSPKDEETQVPPDSPTTDDVSESNATSTASKRDEAPGQQEHEQRGRLPLQPQQQQQPTVIIMGGPRDGRSLPTDLTRRPAPTPSLVVVEALVTIFGTAIRIWMISFIARWWSEEETLRPVQHFVWERLNDKYLRDASALQNVLRLPPTGVAEWRWRLHLRKQRRFEGKTPQRKQLLLPRTFERTVVVLSINEKMDVSHLEQAVTFILSQHREQAFGSIGGLSKELEVVLMVDSPGGAVQDFGLAGAQVRRLSQEAGITTTACVDKIAASGGYMIASQADTILASTFAVVGSIGVIRDNINIHDALERQGVKGTVLKAGDSKVPLTMLGSVTKSDLAKAQNTLDLMHSAFKDFVVYGRPRLGGSIESVANGDIFFGENALELHMIDRIVTSAEYLLERVQAGDRVMQLHRAHQVAIRRKLFHPLDFLREKGVPLKAACVRWLRSDLESKLSHVVTATGVVGTVKFLSQHRFLFFRGLDGTR